MTRAEPSFLMAEPNGEQWKSGNGDEINGPLVCPLCSSLRIALETSLLDLNAEVLLRKEW